MADVPPPPGQSNYYRPGFTPQGTPGPTRPPGVYFDHISTAIEIVRRRLDLFLPTTLLLVVLGYAVQMPFSLLQNIIIKPPRTPADLTPMFFILSFGSSFVFMLIPSMVQAVLWAGMYNLCLKVARHQHAEVGDLFSGFNQFLSLALLALLSNILIGIGAIFCIIPGILAACVLVLAPLIEVRQKIGAVPAMERSYNKLKPFIGQMFGLLIVLGLLNVIGVICCLVGVLFTMPVSITTIALVYNDFFPIDDAFPEMPPMPDQPPTDPA